MEGFLQDFGMCLWEFLPIYPEKHLWDETDEAGSQGPFQVIPKVFDGVEAEILCGPVNFHHIKPILYAPCFVHWGTVSFISAK